MHKVSKTMTGYDITLTRGDSFRATIGGTLSDGTAYEFVTGDTVRFAAKAEYEDNTPAILKEIPVSTMLLALNPIDTKSLDFGEYWYDVELVKADGYTDTFIKGKLTLSEEVY